MVNKICCCPAVTLHSPLLSQALQALITLFVELVKMHVARVAQSNPQAIFLAFLSVSCPVKDFMPVKLPVRASTDKAPGVSDHLYN